MLKKVGVALRMTMIGTIKNFGVLRSGEVECPCESCLYLSNFNLLKMGRIAECDDFRHSLLCRHSFYRQKMNAFLTKEMVVKMDSL